MSLIARDQTVASSLFVFKSLIAEGFSGNVLGSSDSPLTLLCFGKKARRWSHLRKRKGKG